MIPQSMLKVQAVLITLHFDLQYQHGFMYQL